MAFNPGKAPPPPPAKSKKRKEKTPRQVAERSVKIAQEKEEITHAQFNRLWGEYNEIYQDYAGRNASRREAMALINNGISRITLARHLAKLPSFYRSPVWTAKASAYFGTAKSMGVKIDRKFIAKAIVNNWDEANFTEKLRQLPGYLKSNEYRTTVAGLTNSYKDLYGDPTPEWDTHIKEAALGRWGPDQWKSYLRSLPQYRNSSEYQTRLYDLQAAFGFLPTANKAPLIQDANPKGPPKTKR